MNLKRYKRWKKRIELLAVTAVLTLTGCGKAEQETGGSAAMESSVPTWMQETEEDQPLVRFWETETAKNTLMIYMVGSDLESSGMAATQDLEEMVAAGVDTEKVRVLLCTGGATAWHSDIPTDENAYFLLMKDGFRQIEGFEEKSMGDPDNLQRFLQYGYEKCPAENYELILWDHGNGPVMGYGSDKLHENDALTLPEMRQALEQSPFGPERQFAFIGFDACLMASAELALVTADYGKVLIASQETEPSFGWNYSFLPLLAQDMIADIPEKIADSFLEECLTFNREHPLFESDATLSVVDLSQAQELEASVNALFAAAKADVSGGFRELTSQRIETRDIGRASTGSNYDLVDLADLALQMQEKYPEEVENLLAAIEKMVLVNRTNTDRVCGLSLYYPFYNRNYYDFKWRTAYREIGLFRDYISYLDRYEKVWLGSSPENYFYKVLAPEKQDEYTYSLTLGETQAEYFAKAGFYILRQVSPDLFAPVYYSSGVEEEDGTLEASFDGNVIHWQDRFGRNGVLYMSATENTETTIKLSTTARLLRGPALQRESVDVEYRMEADPEEKTLAVTGILEEAPNSEEEELSTGKRAFVDPAEWDILQLYDAQSRFLTRDAGGNVLSFRDWDAEDSVTWTENALADEIDFTYAPLRDNTGEYYLMFDIMDIQGNFYGSELLPIAVIGQDEDEEDEEEICEVSFDSGRELVIWEQEDSILSLWLGQDLRDGQKFVSFCMENNGQTDLTAVLTGLLMNDESRAPEDVVLTAKAGQRAFASVDTITRGVAESGGIPASLSFRVSVNSSVTGATYAYRVPYEVTFADNLSAEPVLLPVKGCAAGEQLLCRTGDCTITLLGAGLALRQGRMGDNNLQCYFAVQNTSDRELTVKTDRITLNGIDFDVWDRITLPAGFSGIMQSGVYLGNLSEEKAETLSEIQTLEFTFSSGETQMAAKAACGNRPTELKAQSTFFAENGYVRFPQEGLSVYRDDSMTLTLFAAYDFSDNYELFYLDIVNLTEETKEISLCDFGLNGNIVLPRMDLISLAPGEERFAALPGLASTMLLLSQDEIRSVEGRIVTNGDLEHWAQMEAQVPENGETQLSYHCDLFLGAVAGEQKLLNRKDMQITLRGFGEFAESTFTKELGAVLAIENNADQTKEVRINGLAINDFFFPVESNVTCKLAAWENTILTVKLQRAALDKAGINGIKKASILISTGDAKEAGEGTWYEVKLAAKSKEKQNLPTGKVVQKLKNVSVSLLDAEVRENTTDQSRQYSWQLLIDNGDRRHVSLALKDISVNGEPLEKSRYKDFDILYSETGAKTRRYAVLRATAQAEEVWETVELTFVLRDLNGKTTLATAGGKVSFSCPEAE